MTQGDRDLIERLMDVLSSDHKRGCDGRTYTCNCGYDDQVEQIADQATDRLEARLDEVGRLREALEPFASIADLIESETEGFDDSDDFQLIFNDYLMERFSVRQFKEARQALKGANNG